MIIWKREAARVIRSCLESDTEQLGDADRLTLLDVQIALMREGLY